MGEAKEGKGLTHSHSLYATLAEATWRGEVAVTEIRAGCRMSKGEKRMRRLAKHMGSTETPDGGIQLPPAAENPGYYLVFGGLRL